MKKLILKIKPYIAKKLEHFLLLIASKSASRRRCKKINDKILIARTDGMGDFILWLDTQNILRELYPQKKLVVLLDKEKPTLLLAEKIDSIDEIICVHVNRYVRFFEILRLRKMSFDAVIQPVYGRTAFTDLLLFSCRANQRITLDGNKRFLSAWEKNVTDAGYDKIIKTSDGVCHELFRNRDLLLGLGVEDAKVTIPQIPKTGAKKPILDENYILIYPGGSWSEKCLEVEKVAEVVDWILTKTQVSVYICGGYNDIEQANKVKNAMQNKENVNVVAGQHNICESVEVIRGAKLVFGNDTGALHIAVACNIPTVAIVVSREIGRFFPLNLDTTKETMPISIFADVSCGNCFDRGVMECPYRNENDINLRCISEISVEDIINSISHLF